MTIGDDAHVGVTWSTILVLTAAVSSVAVISPGAAVSSVSVTS